MAPPQKRTGPSSAGSGLTKKIGPLPVWGYIAAIVIGYIIYKKYTAQTSASTSTSTTAQTAAEYQAMLAAQQETLTTPGGTYTGPVGGAPSSITNPSGSGSSTATPAASGASTTPSTPGSSATSPNTPGSTGGIPTSPQTFYNTGPTGTTAAVNPAAYAAPAGSNTPAAQQAQATTNPDGSITYGPSTISNQAIANQGLLQSLGYTPQEIAAFEAQ
jgi:hypothetical protein